LRPLLEKLFDTVNIQGNDHGSYLGFRWLPRFFERGKQRYKTMFRTKERRNSFRLRDIKQRRASLFVNVTRYFLER